LTKRVDRTRINQNITAKEVRVVGVDGEQLGVISIDDALQRARDNDLDLVEVAPNGKPPVCKIMNYGKYRYQLSKKEAKSRRNQKQIQVKEMKFRPKTDEHDFNFKIKHIIRFLEKGNLVRVHVHFRGREITHRDLGRDILDRVYEQISDLATKEGNTKMEGRNMIMLLTPKKEA